MRPRPNGADYRSFTEYELAIARWEEDLILWEGAERLVNSSRPNVATVRAGVDLGTVTTSEPVTNAAERTLTYQVDMSQTSGGGRATVNSTPSGNGITWQDLARESMFGAPNFSSSKKKKMKIDEKVFKERHLQRDERSMLHHPKSDWCESPKGDICKSACTLEISDLIAKIK